MVYYLLAISVLAVLLTIIDKQKARKHKWRIPETTLMVVGGLGGALPMYITMKIIRHKTLHKKFMIGLPVEFLVQVIIIAVYVTFK